LALFVIVSGALLMLGGAASLLAGFDIVMTERGAAMTIGGIVALSGGLVAVGLGFTLVRLSQILRTLSVQAARPGRSTVLNDRPTVPTLRQQPQEDVQQQVLQQQVLPQQALPQGVLPHEVLPQQALPREGVRKEVLPIHAPDLPGAVSSTIRTPLVAGAGLVAAGLAGGAALARRPTADDIPLVISERDLMDLPPPAAGVSALPDTVITAGLETVEAGSFATAAVPVDLEDELARALAEPDAPPGPKEQSFGDGLSAFLSSPKPVVKVEAEDVVLDEQALSITADDAPVSLAVLPENEEAAGGDYSDLVEPGKADDLNVLPGDVLPGDAPFSSDAVAQLQEDHDDAGLSDVGEVDELVSAAQVDAYAPPPVVPRRPGVLGTYNSGGRTYSMFADGSVEAVTEFGVERFSSMDALRKHLVNG
jgi:hypothetical protein